STAGWRWRRWWWWLQLRDARTRRGHELLPREQSGAREGHGPLLRRLQSRRAEQLPEGPGNGREALEGVGRSHAALFKLASPKLSARGPSAPVGVRLKARCSRAAREPFRRVRRSCMLRTSAP